MKSNSFKNKLNSVSDWYSSYTGLNGFMIKCIYTEFKPYIKEPILEIGAADGYMTKLITGDFDFKNYTIVEGSSKYSTLLKEKYPTTMVNNVLIEDFKTEKKYKTIIASHVLEHVNNPIVFLKSILHLLESDGKLLVSVPNALSFHRLLGVEMNIIPVATSLNSSDIEIGHFRVYDKQSLNRDLSESGFNILKIGGSFIKFLSNIQTEKKIPKKTWKYYYSLSHQFQDNCSDLYAICTKIS